MAKQKPTKQQTQHPHKKQTVSLGGGISSYLLRNLIVTAGVLLIFWVVWSKFSKERHLSDLTEQFYQLRASNPNSAELRDVYNEIMELQPEVIADTSFLTRITRGYHWAIHDLCLGNLDNIERIKEEMHNAHQDSTDQAYLEAKWERRIDNHVYSIIKYINNNVPKDAVIFLPAGDSIISNDSKWSFIYEPEWMEYFIYPRLCVSIGHEKDHPDLAKRANYVIIARGKGYEKLKYDIPVDQRPSEAVLPIDRPLANKNGGS